ncbi:MAG: hypothetical protein ACLRLD_03815 [Lachnospira sp.]
MRDSIIEFLNNIKIELLSVGIFIFMLIFNHFEPLNINIQSYLTENRMNGIATFFSITIGIYITVITILSTSEISISKEMLKRKLDKPLINVIVAGMVEDFISVGLVVFAPLNSLTSKMVVIFVIISIISFVKFIILLIVIFKENMNQMAKSIDEEEDNKQLILIYLREIAKHYNDKL